MRYATGGLLCLLILLSGVCGWAEDSYNPLAFLLGMVFASTNIAKKLDELGIDFIEGGWPGANPKDVQFFKKAHNIKFKKSRLVAFGSTRRANTDVSKDSIIAGLLEANVDVITIFGKSWDLHVKEVLKTTLDENINMIEDSVKFLKSKGKMVIFDAEHFFDGYKNNPSYALKTLLSAEKGGADRIVLCDTNGGMVTSKLFEIIKEVKNTIKVPLGIHTHNDSDMAVANSIAAVQAGCVQVQGTINGYGERCGNANLISIIPNLILKLGTECISLLSLKDLTEGAHYINKLELTTTGWTSRSRTGSVALLRIELMSARITPGSDRIVCRMDNHPA